MNTETKALLVSMGIDYSPKPLPPLPPLALQENGSMVAIKVYAATQEQAETTWNTFYCSELTDKESFESCGDSTYSGYLWTTPRKLQRFYEAIERMSFDLERTQRVVTPSFTRYIERKASERIANIPRGRFADIRLADRAA